MSTPTPEREEFRSEVESLRARVGQLEALLAQEQADRQALAAQAQDFAGILEASPAIILTVNRDGTILYINRTVPGITVAEALGTSAYGYVPPEYHDRLRKAFEHVFQTGETFSYEIAGTGPHGTISWYATRIGPLKRNGQVVAAALIATDISERKRAEEALQKTHEELERRVQERTAKWAQANEALRMEIAEHQRAAGALWESEERFKAFVDNSPSVAFMKDEEGRWIYSNKPFQRLFHKEPDSMLGKTDFDLFPAEIARQLRENDAAVLAANKPLETIETVPTPDGVLRHWLVFKFPVEDATGRRFLGGVAVDITERKQAEEALFEMNVALANAMPGISRLDAEGRYVHVNQTYADMLGHPPDELIGMDWKPTVHPDDWAKVESAYQRMLREGKGEFEALAVRKDGSTFHKHVLMVKIADPQGNATGHHCFMRDISERKQAEEERRQLEAQIQHAQKLESLGVMAGGIAHDFNNLLTGMLGYASLALQDLPPEAPARYIVQQIETAALRAADLTQQMLAYSGKGRFVVRSIQLSRVVEEMAGLLQTAISKKALLRFDFAPNLPAVEADPTQLRQVVMNLITNASDAIGQQSGVITIRTGVMQAEKEYLLSTYVPEDLPEGYYTYLEVADTGCGMDETTLANIFDPFFTTKFTGRGLGLAAVLGIVRGHRGAIKVSSEPGRGTTFKVLFPCSDLAEGAPAEVPLAHTPWRGSGTILVIDDEETVRAVAKRALEIAGFQALLAPDGPEGLEAFRRHGPEIIAVVLDLTMPHLSGEEVFHELKLLRPDVRVVLMSGYNEQEVANLFAGKGLAGFVQKPFRVNDFLAVLRRTLER